MGDVRNLFGQRVRYIRRLRNMTQAQLAERVDLSINYISQIENGGASPGFDTIVKIATGLHVAVRDLFDFPDPSEEELS